jgi:very-short-patch-repair endonuclease
MSAGQAFTGPTAGRLLELPRPARIEGDVRLHVSSLRPQRAMRRPGVVGTSRGFGEVESVVGLPVLVSELTWIALARSLALPDLVAAGDRLLSGDGKRAAVTTREALVTAVDRSRGVPGAAQARAALPHLRERAWSRPETLLRLLLLDAGLPEPRLNAEVPLRGGRIAIPDLSWPVERVAVEYDGWWHAEQSDRDADRHERLVDVGWLVVHVRKHDLFREPATVVRRVLDRLAQRGYRPRAPTDVTRLRRFVP